MRVSQGNSGLYSAWVPTFTGFSADPTGVTARYYIRGKFCHIYITMTAGTSNATGFTFTAPVAAANTAIIGDVARVQDNGTNAVGRINTAANSNVITLFPSATGSSWTASGNKSATIDFTYETV